MDVKNTRTTILNQGDPEQKREEIREYFHATYTIDEKLYDTLASDDAFYFRAEPLRHPLIFYLGHTAVFYVNKLIVAQIIQDRINPRFESMFAVGVDEMSWDDLNEAHYDWPSVAEVREYRNTVRDLVDETIRNTPLTMPIDWDNPFWTFMMGIEHQRIHLETSAVIIRRMPIEMVRQLPLWDICPDRGEPPENDLVPVAGGRVVQGKAKGHPLYGWDNEFGREETDVWDFAASRMLVSNREFLGFMEDGGYETEEFWTREGWNWVGYSQAKHPLFWVESDGGYRFRTMAQIIEMPWNWPVEVNHLEAKAFANWKAKRTGKPIRLPTEAEWVRLRNVHDIPDQPYWDKAPGNINLEHWASSCPVDRFGFGEFYDIIGNVWQWTETPISGFDGFEIHPYYDDFSTPTFDTLHNLFKGGSWISTGNEATKDSRYAFRRHFFSVCRDPLRRIGAAAPGAGGDVRDGRRRCRNTATPISENPTLASPVSKRGARNSAPRLLKGDPARRPWISAAPSAGRRSNWPSISIPSPASTSPPDSSGLRCSSRRKEIPCTNSRRRETWSPITRARLDDLGLAYVKDRVDFAQGDATNLKPLLTGYDLILAANLLDRLSDPERFTETIHERLNPGGILVIASPYTWLEQYTKKENWLGGYRYAGEPYTTLEGLHEHLGKHFEMLGDPRDVEFVIRETARKFQHCVSQVTVWKLR